MATFTHSISFGNDWPPATVEGGTILTRTATSMTYTSEMGYTITLRGVGLTYDTDGSPNGGTVTRVTIALGATTYADFTGVSAGFERLSMWAFGYDRGPQRGFQNPDGYYFMQHLLRGNDSVIGSAQDDELTGGRGNDTINAGSGFDYITGDAGNDLINGGGDRDTLSYDETYYDYTAYRGILLDALAGTVADSWGGNDTISGFERYRDSVFNDTMNGSNNNDEFYLTRGNDVVDGRDGFDSVNYRNSERNGGTHGVIVNLATGVAIDAWGGTDTLSNIEEVQGSSFNDTLTGSSRDEYFQGAAGVDMVNGGTGFDVLGLWQADYEPGGHAAIVNLAIIGANITDDGFGNTENVLGIEAFDGTRFNDKFTGNGASNTFWGNDGNDSLYGGGGGDELTGGYGNDVISGSTGADSMGGGEGNDRLTGGTGGDQFNFYRPLAVSGVDLIVDMEAGIDHIWVDSAWGGGLVAEDLLAAQFRSGAGVTTANTTGQRVIYNSTTGDLYFDADGVGGAAAVRFATLSNHAAITFADIQVFL